MSAHRLSLACALVTIVASVAAGLPLAYVALLGVAAVAAATDATSYRIPNQVALVAAPAAAAVWVHAGAPLDALIISLIIGVLLVIGFSFELAGGGDVKLMPALILGAASAGDPLLMPVRLGVFAVVLLSTAIVWSQATRHRQAPLAVGGPLALSCAVLL